MNIDFKIQSIHYEKTFETLYPHLLEAVKGMNGENLIVRLMQKLGESSRNVFMGILKNIGDILPHTVSQIVSIAA